MALLQSLKRLAGQQRTTMVVLLMAAFKTLMYRLSGQTDIVLGLGAAGQAITGKTCLVGHCVNLLPIRTRLQPDTSFKETLGAIEEAYWMPMITINARWEAHRSTFLCRVMPAVLHLSRSFLT